MVKEIEVLLSHYFVETVDLLGRRGLLLVSGDNKKTDVTTIGWVLSACLSGKPFLMLAARLSRYTRRFIEGMSDFTDDVFARDSLTRLS